jgi:hypothetical protein
VIRNNRADPIPQPQVAMEYKMYGENGIRKTNWIQSGSFLTDFQIAIE